MRFAKRWRNLIIIPSFQYSEHALESYCHCASISVYVIHLKRNRHRILVEVYGEYVLAERTCQIWFARFKSGDFGLEDEECPRQPKKLEDEELEALLDEDCCQTQEEIAESLGATQAAISKRLKAAGYIQKQGNWVPHELQPRYTERRSCMSEMLLERHKKK